MLWKIHKRNALRKFKCTRNPISLASIFGAVCNSAPDGVAERLDQHTPLHYLSLMIEALHRGDPSGHKPRAF